MKYKKKSNSFDAVQWDGTNLEEVKEFVGEDNLKYRSMGIAWQQGKHVTYYYLEIIPPEGEDIYINFGDYIIEVANGIFCPCNPDSFNDVYESNI